MDKVGKNFDITLTAEKVPENIDEVDDGILKEAIGCAHTEECEHGCNMAFRITDFDLRFYKKHNIPIPNICPNCRYYERLKLMPGLKLYHRSCMKEGCQNEFETPYAPNRPEIVYCERCYQQAVY